MQKQEIQEIYLYRIILELASNITVFLILNNIIKQSINARNNKCRGVKEEEVTCLRKMDLLPVKLQKWVYLGV